MKFAPLAFVLLLVGLLVWLAVHDHSWWPLVLAAAVLSIGIFAGVFRGGRWS